MNSFGSGYFGGSSSSAQKSPLFQDDETMLQRRLAQIEMITNPEEKEAALQALARDYPGRVSDAAANAEFMGGMATAGMPKGGVAGPASNPFSVYIAANPLEHAAAGAEKYMGHKGRREAMAAVEAERSMMQQEMAKMLRAGLSDDEERRRYRGF